MTKGHQQNLRAGRYSQNGCAYHVTFRVDKNRPELPENNRHFIARYLESEDLKCYWKLLTWVIMPDHVHLLFELNGKKTLSQLIGRLKSKTSLDINKLDASKTSLWQKGFYDHGIRSDESLIEVSRYIVANPIRAHLVGNVGMYPYWNSIWLNNS